MNGISDFLRSTAGMASVLIVFSILTAILAFRSSPKSVMAANEQLKLRAIFLNTLAVSILVALGITATISGTVRSMLPDPAERTLFFLMMISMAAFLHSLAVFFLSRLRQE